MDNRNNELMRTTAIGAIRAMPAPGKHPATPRAIIAPRQAVPRAKVGRNAPCPCRSGKKYKKCCLPRPKGHRPANKLPRAKPLIDDATVATTAATVAPASKQVTAQAMLNARVPQRIVWAYLETGLYITEINKAAHPAENIEKWEQAIKQFDAATEEEREIFLTAGQ